MSISATPLSSAPLTILLVEDDDVDVMNVRRILRKANAPNPLVVARDGVEALSVLDGAHPERLVLVLDLNMPRMNGLELLRALRAEPRFAALPAVVLTTSSDDRDRAEASRLNVAAYLVKPLTATTLAEVLTLAERHWSARA